MDNTITFNTENSEMLRVAKDGFYVRGEKVPQDEYEALKVYDAFVAWLRTTGHYNPEISERNEAPCTGIGGYTIPGVAAGVGNIVTAWSAGTTEEDKLEWLKRNPEYVDGSR